MRIDWSQTRARLTSAGRVRCEAGWKLDESFAQRLKDFDLWFVWAGRGRMELLDRQVDLRPGVCFWMRPGRRYLARQDLSDRLGVSFIHFDLLAPDGGRRASDGPLPPEVFTVGDLHMYDAVTRRLADLCLLGGSNHPTARTQGVADALLTGLLIDLDHHTDHGPRPAGGTDALHRRMALELASAINESPHQVPPVAEMARQAGYSPDHFARIFKSILGQSPQAYAIQARINRAKQLLAESGLPVSRIADALGYDDVFFFSRQFKAKTGQSPRRFRQERG